MDVTKDAAGRELVNGAFLGRQRFARTKLLDNVVHAGHGNALIARDCRCAVRVEGLGEGGDTGAQCGRRIGERERVEAQRLLIAWSVLERPATRERPFNVQ